MRLELLLDVFWTAVNSTPVSMLGSRFQTSQNSEVLPYNLSKSYYYYYHYHTTYQNYQYINIP